MQNNCRKLYLWPFGNLGIGISASASALTSAWASALQRIYFVLRSLYFCLSKFYMKKTSMVKYFSSTLAGLSCSFIQCLEQLFCRKPVSVCYLRKALHSRRYLRSFKNTQGLKLHFASLEISDKEPHQRSLPGNFL